MDTDVNGLEVLSRAEAVALLETMVAGRWFGPRSDPGCSRSDLAHAQA
jgi:hypothetical protein